MKRPLALAAIAIAATLTAACASASPPAPTATTAPAVPTTAPTVAAAPTTSAATTPGAPGTITVPQSTDGTVKSIGDGKLTLVEGQTFNLTDKTNYSLRSPVQVSALQPGQYVAVTAKRQPDNTLAAS